MLHREEKRSGNFETIIGPSVKVEGNFVGEGDVVVDGIVTGSLKTDKDLRVGSTAKIQADVEAANVIVAGEIKGNVNCRDRLVMAATARIIGNVRATQLTVAEGALLHGKCSMLNGKENGQLINQPAPDNARRDNLPKR